MSKRESIKINLGSGESPKEGYVNIDKLDIPEVDVICDIEKEALPFEDSSVSVVNADHFFEHIADTISLFEEIHRVCKDGAIVKFKVPYFKSTGAFKDPTHVSFFTERTFEYFDKEYIEKNNLPDYNLNFNFKTKEITYMWSYEWLRLLPFKKAFFMKYFWNIVRTMYVELRVIKN